MIYECMGKYAAEPYYFEGVCLNVFSIEELCYYLKENVGLLDESVMNEELTGFIDDGLMLPELAARLRDIMGSGGNAADFVCEILRFTCFASADEIEEIRKAVNGCVDVRPGIRRKSRGDFLFGNGKYPAAAEEYLQALSANPEDEENLNASIYHNLGAVYAKMFLFANAADCFQKSYSISRSEDTLRCFLVAERMQMSSDEFAKFIVDKKLGSEMVNEAETIVKNPVTQDITDERLRKLTKLRNESIAFRNEDKINDYLDRTDEIIMMFKTDYRKR